MHMIHKGQMECPDVKTMSVANQFYSHAALSPTPRRNSFRPDSVIATEPGRYPQTAWPIKGVVLAFKS
jgi:hypothetical protein